MRYFSVAALFMWLSLNGVQASDVFQTIQEIRRHQQYCSQQDTFARYQKEADALALSARELQKGNYVEALRLIENQKREQKSIPDMAYWISGLAHFCLGDLEKANQELLKGLAINNRNEELRSLWMDVNRCLDEAYFRSHRSTSTGFAGS